MSQAVIKSLFAQRSRDFLKDVLSRFTDGGPKAPDILLVVKTTHPDAVLPDYLKEEYPEAIHLVFGGYSENLLLGDEGFDVTLSFGDGYEDLSIPFDAIEGLVCQDESFALQLPSMSDQSNQVASDEEESSGRGSSMVSDTGTTEGDDDKNHDREGNGEIDSTEDKSDTASAAGDNVVTLDAFRRK